MHRAWVFFAALGLLGSPAAFEEAELSDFQHHGFRHVDGDASGHHHGDADDHHESSDSPCHHHETEICLGHGHELAVTPEISIVEPGAAEPFAIPSVTPSNDVSIHTVFHIPIA
jgi:hypothetical protein